MDNFIRWMEKKAFNGVSFEPVSFGSDYFYNAPAIHFEGVLVHIPWTSGYYHAAKIAKDIKKYVSRYGYTVIADGHNLGGLYFSVCKPADVDALNLYLEYQDRSVKQFELVQHNFYTGRITLNGHSLNDVTRAIMDKWERRYMAALMIAKEA